MNVSFCSGVVRAAVDAASCVKLSLAQLFSTGRLWIVFLTPFWSTWLYPPLPGIAWLVVNAKRELAPKLCAAKNSRSVFTRGGLSY
jgi:hypothetical protein